MKMPYKEHDLTPEEGERLSHLFNQLDVDKDGLIDVNDLTEALHLLQVPVVPGQAQVCFINHSHFTEI